MDTYVLQLESDKYYIGRTCNLKNRIYSNVCADLKMIYYHYPNSKHGSVWTRKYKIRKVVAVYGGENNNEFENKIIIERMYKHGVENVRGGRYCRENLSKRLMREIDIQINALKEIN